MSDVGIEGKNHRSENKVNRLCPDCDRPRISYGWCRKCESRCMEKKFPFWTSGNKNLDKLIQRSQILSMQICDYLEFIKFKDIEFGNIIAKGGFSKVYKGVWIDGPRWNWDELGDIWCRSGPTEVALKELDNSQILSFEFLEQNGNLYEFLDRNKGIISWRDMVDMLWGIATTGLKPHHNRAHDLQLAYEICYENLRPEINEDLKSEMPIEYYNLMIQCWDPLPENRPTASRLNEILGDWISDICDNPEPSEISNNFGDAEERRWELIGKQNEEKNFPSSFVHKDAIYISRGYSIFADSFAAVERLKADYPSDYLLLTKIPITFHYLNDGHHMHYNRPVIELDHFNNSFYVNYSPPFQGPFESLLHENDTKILELYQAYKRFCSFVEDPNLKFKVKLNPNELVIFMNRRVLHGRTSYDSQSGERHLKGAYLDFSEFKDKFR
ncbi:232_t:CDS:2, partial [Scutellospora calospora]